MQFPFNIYNSLISMGKVLGTVVVVEILDPFIAQAGSALLTEYFQM